MQVPRGLPAGDRRPGDQVLAAHGRTPWPGHAPRPAADRGGACRCMSPKPEERPSAKELVHLLEDLSGESRASL